MCGQLLRDITPSVPFFFTFVQLKQTVCSPTNWLVVSPTNAEKKTLWTITGWCGCGGERCNIDVIFPLMRSPSDHFPDVGKAHFVLFQEKESTL